MPNGARVERHPARSGPAARRGTVKVPSVVAGGRDASTGRRSRPEVGSTRAPFVGAKRRRTNLLTGAAPLDEHSNTTTGYGAVSGAAAS